MLEFIYLLLFLVKKKKNEIFTILEPSSNNFCTIESKSFLLLINEVVCRFKTRNQSHNAENFCSASAYRVIIINAPQVISNIFQWFRWDLSKCSWMVWWLSTKQLVRNLSKKKVLFSFLLFSFKKINTSNNPK